ncbi:MAG: ABC-ATPase domain-containing protein, partial [Thermodesulfobacteriota bacterium]|nr:ABC-ATPase domain-containing protein [Thermodesulfobacteriota bacterium]
MNTKEELRKILYRINGKGYKAYKDIEGFYDFYDYILTIEHVQGDPFASPSRITIKVAHKKSKFPVTYYNTKVKKIALSDFLTREFYKNAKMIAKGNRGIGNSGIITIDDPGQEVLERSSVLIGKEFIEARFVMGLPASGRTILGKEIEIMLFKELPQIVHMSLLHANLNQKKLLEHVQSIEDQEYLHKEIQKLDFVGFIADNSILPRRSGIDDRPMTDKSKLILFKSPPSLEVKISLPHKGEIIGMGIPKGITLIVGGGFHGKSTLLNALEKGIYFHIPGDGREYIATDRTTVKIKAEDGRYVEKVNISPFINNLPFGANVSEFSTENASGSTSQAANIIEAVEIGTKVILIDEDTSATNFMIRDVRMQELVAKHKEPITPFIDKVRSLYKDYNVSTVLVMGGSGDYFDVADTVIMLDNYLPQDVTPIAKIISEKHKTERICEGGDRFGKISSRIPLNTNFNPKKGKKMVKIEAKNLRKIIYGHEIIDL